MTDKQQHDRDIEVATALGSINTSLISIDTRLRAVESDLKSVVGTVNRWKGATALMVVVGGILGWLANLFVRSTHT
jgi:hypothetical protein